MDPLESALDQLERQRDELTGRIAMLRREIEARQRKRAWRAEIDRLARAWRHDAFDGWSWPAIVDHVADTLGATGQRAEHVARAHQASARRHRQRARDLAIHARHLAGESKRQLARAYGVSPSTVRRAIDRIDGELDPYG